MGCKQVRSAWSALSSTSQSGSTWICLKPWLTCKCGLQSDSCQVPPEWRSEHPLYQWPFSLTWGCWRCQHQTLSSHAFLRNLRSAIFWNFKLWAPKGLKCFRLCLRVTKRSSNAFCCRLHQEFLLRCCIHSSAKPSTAIAVKVLLQDLSSIAHSHAELSSWGRYLHLEQKGWSLAWRNPLQPTSLAPAVLHTLAFPSISAWPSQWPVKAAQQG